MDASTAPKSRTDELLAEVRRMPAFRQLVPAEAGIAWPLPLRRNGQVYVVLPFFGMEAQRTGGAALYRPFATMTLLWPNGTPVEYVNLRFRDPRPEAEWNEPVGRFPHDALAEVSPDVYVRLRRELCYCYDRLLESLAAGTALATEDEQEFSRLLRLLFEPGLEPFYRQLGPGELGARFCDRFLKPAAE